MAVGSFDFAWTGEVDSFECPVNSNINDIVKYFKMYSLFQNVVSNGYLGNKQHNTLVGETQKTVISDALVLNIKKNETKPKRLAVTPGGTQVATIAAQCGAVRRLDGTV